MNLAARVRNEAGPDQILVTDLVRSLASGEPEFRYRVFKDAKVKGFDGSIRIYELLWRDEPDEVEGSTDNAVAAAPGGVSACTSTTRDPSPGA